MGLEVPEQAEAAQETPWWVYSPERAAEYLGVDLGQGLSAAEAQRRLAACGRNRLEEHAVPSRWSLFVSQFKNLLVIVLLAAALLAGAVGDWLDSAVIGVVVLFNALLGFRQEYLAQRTLDALKRMLARQAQVRRDGAVQVVAAERLVPGDVVLLDAGDRVPADGRVFVAHSAEVNEAALTGESVAVEKSAGAVLEEDIPLAERVNMAYMNTVVTRGRLELLVTETGMRTEMGRITGMLETAEERPTPLQVQLDQLGKRLAVIAGLVVAGLFLLGLLRQQPLVDTALTAIALAVAAIPEGLPAVVTVTLAIGMHRMARHRAILKRMAAVETLGSCTVICSDKTGTLTLNEMTVRALFFRGCRFKVSGGGYTGSGNIEPLTPNCRLDLTPLLLPAALCNDSSIDRGQVIGDPTEGALLALSAKGGIEPTHIASILPRIAEIPFDSDHKFMATFHEDGDEVRVYVKGAPDVLLTRCSRILGRRGEDPLERGRGEVTAEYERLAGEAMRVLALASRTLPATTFDPKGNLFDYVSELTFVGLAGIIDPPRPEAREAIAQCAEAGIAVKMITGDHAATAVAIGRELGLEGEVMAGGELQRISVAALAERIERVAVFARVAPEHKVKIVKALKARGEIVAMTGDGVNDAPALKIADIGVAMGITGTEVTKEAATMVLTDDNFATLVRAVREGRTIYENIVKFVRFQLSTNIGAILTVASAPLLGVSVPFTPVQILWINIIMDGPPAMTLGVEPPREDIMRERPREPQASILNLGRLGRLLAYGMTMAIGTLALFHYGLSVTPGYAVTLAFTTFVLFQFFNVFNARAEARSAFNRQFFSNGKLWLALVGVVVLQALVVHWPPAQRVFHTTDLTLADWALATAVASSILLLDEARKALLRVWNAARGQPRASQ